MVCKVVLNRTQISRQLLKGKGTQEYLRTIAQRVSRQCAVETDVDLMQGQRRTNARVTTATSEAFYKNLHTNDLLNSLY